MSRKLIGVFVMVGVGVAGAIMARHNPERRGMTPNIEMIDNGSTIQVKSSGPLKEQCFSATLIKAG